MLQQREISKLLGQVVERPDSAEPAADYIYSASLLSAKGLPLITVTSLVPTSVTPDDLRIYHLLAVNLYDQQERTGDPNLDSWAALDLDNSLRAMVKHFKTSAENTGHSAAFFVALIYSSTYDDASAKVRLDQLTDSLASGLSGYRAG